MNTITRCLAILSLGFTSALLSAGVFEGRVSLKIKDEKGKETVLNQAIKEHCVRNEPQDPEAQGAAMILNNKTMEMTMLMPSEKMYMVMSLKAQVQAAAKEKAETATIEKTGETETIQGYLCEKYLVKDDGETSEIWATDKLGNFMGLGAGNPMVGMMGGEKSSAPSWEAAFKGREGFFPMRVITRNKKGKVTSQMEVVSVKKESLPDSLFVVPEGYNKFQMPSMGGF